MIVVLIGLLRLHRPQQHRFSPSEYSVLEDTLLAVSACYFESAG